MQPLPGQPPLPPPPAPAAAAAHRPTSHRLNVNASTFVPTRPAAAPPMAGSREGLDGSTAAADAHAAHDSSQQRPASSIGTAALSLGSRLRLAISSDNSALSRETSDLSWSSATSGVQQQPQPRRMLRRPEHAAAGDALPTGGGFDAAGLVPPEYGYAHEEPTQSSGASISTVKTALDHPLGNGVTAVSTVANLLGDDTAATEESEERAIPPVRSASPAVDTVDRSTRGDAVDAYSSTRGVAASAAAYSGARVWRAALAKHSRHQQAQPPLQQPSIHLPGPLLDSGGDSSIRHDHLAADGAAPLYEGAAESRFGDTASLDASTTIGSAASPPLVVPPPPPRMSYELPIGPSDAVIDALLRAQLFASTGGGGGDAPSSATAATGDGDGTANRVAPTPLIDAGPELTSGFADPLTPTSVWASILEWEGQLQAAIAVRDAPTAPSRSIASGPVVAVGTAVSSGGAPSALATVYTAHESADNSGSVSEPTPTAAERAAAVSAVGTLRRALCASYALCLLQATRTACEAAALPPDTGAADSDLPFDTAGFTPPSVSSSTLHHIAQHWLGGATASAPPAPSHADADPSSSADAAAAAPLPASHAESAASRLCTLLLLEPVRGRAALRAAVVELRTWERSAARQLQQTPKQPSAPPTGSAARAAITPATQAGGSDWAAAPASRSAESSPTASPGDALAVRSKQQKTPSSAQKQPALRRQQQQQQRQHQELRFGVSSRALRSTRAAVSARGYLIGLLQRLVQLVQSVLVPPSPIEGVAIAASAEAAAEPVSGDGVPPSSTYFSSSSSSLSDGSKHIAQPPAAASSPSIFTAHAPVIVCSAAAVLLLSIASLSSQVGEARDAHGAYGLSSDPPVGLTSADEIPAAAAVLPPPPPAATALPPHMLAVLNDPLLASAATPPQRLSQAGANQPRFPNTAQQLLLSRLMDVALTLRPSASRALLQRGLLAAAQPHRATQQMQQQQQAGQQPQQAGQGQGAAAYDPMFSHFQPGSDVATTIRLLLAAYRIALARQLSHQRQHRDRAPSRALAGETLPSPTTPPVHVLQLPGYLPAADDDDDVDGDDEALHCTAPSALAQLRIALAKADEQWTSLGIQSLPLLPPPPPAGVAQSLPSASASSQVSSDPLYAPDAPLVDLLAAFPAPAALPPAFQVQLASLQLRIPYFRLVGRVASIFEQVHSLLLVGPHGEGGEGGGAHAPEGSGTGGRDTPLGRSDDDAVDGSAAERFTLSVVQHLEALQATASLAILQADSMLRRRSEMLSAAAPVEGCRDPAAGGGGTPLAGDVGGSYDCALGVVSLPLGDDAFTLALTHSVHVILELLQLSALLPHSPLRADGNGSIPLPARSGPPPSASSPRASSTTQSASDVTESAPEIGVTSSTQSEYTASSSSSSPVIAPAVRKLTASLFVLLLGVAGSAMRYSLGAQGGHRWTGAVTVACDWLAFFAPAWGAVVTLVPPNALGAFLRCVARLVNDMAAERRTVAVPAVLVRVGGIVMDGGRGGGWGISGGSALPTIPALISSFAKEVDASSSVMEPAVVAANDDAGLALLYRAVSPFYPPAPLTTSASTRLNRSPFPPLLPELTLPSTGRLAEAAAGRVMLSFGERPGLACPHSPGPSLLITNSSAPAVTPTLIGGGDADATSQGPTGVATVSDGTSGVATVSDGTTGVATVSDGTSGVTPTTTTPPLPALLNARDLRGCWLYLAAHRLTALGAHPSPPTSTTAGVESTSAVPSLGGGVRLVWRGHEASFAVEGAAYVSYSQPRQQQQHKTPQPHQQQHVLQRGTTTVAATTADPRFTVSDAPGADADDVTGSSAPPSPPSSSASSTNDAPPPPTGAFGGDIRASGGRFGESDTDRGMDGHPPGGYDDAIRDGGTGGGSGAGEADYYDARFDDDADSRGTYEWSDLDTASTTSSTSSEEGSEGEGRCGSGSGAGVMTPDEVHPLLRVSGDVPSSSLNAGGVSHGPQPARHARSHPHPTSDTAVGVGFTPSGREIVEGQVAGRIREGVHRASRPKPTPSSSARRVRGGAAAASSSDRGRGAIVGGVRQSSRTLFDPNAPPAPAPAPAASSSPMPVTGNRLPILSRSSAAAPPSTPPLPQLGDSAHGHIFGGLGTSPGPHRLPSSLQSPAPPPNAAAAAAAAESSAAAVPVPGDSTSKRRKGGGGGGRNIVVIDGPNVAMRAGGSVTFCAAGLALAARQLAAAGYRVKAFLPAGTLSPEGVAGQRRAAAAGFFVSPARLPDDLAPLHALVNEGENDGACVCVRV